MKRRHEQIPHHLNPDLKPRMLYALVLAGIIYFDEKSAKWHFKEEGLADRVQRDHRGSSSDTRYQQHLDEMLQVSLWFSKRASKDREMVFGLAFVTTYTLKIKDSQQSH